MEAVEDHDTYLNASDLLSNIVRKQRVENSSYIHSMEWDNKGYIN